MSEDTALRALLPGAYAASAVSRTDIVAPDEVAILAVRELRRVGGSCPVGVLRDQIAGSFDASSLPPRRQHAFRKRFDQQFHWAMWALMAMDHVRRTPSKHDPDGRYELANPPLALDEEELRTRCRELLRGMSTFVPDRTGPTHRLPDDVPGCAAACGAAGRDRFG
jgi:hypothetical protein